MLKCISLSNYGFIVLSILSGCSTRDDAIAFVTSDVYASQSCWVDRDNKLVAYLILAKQQQLVVPYLLSAKCLVKGDYTSDGEAILHHINTVRLSDLRGNLQRRLPELKVIENVGTDLPQPGSDSRVYYLKGNLESLNNPYYKLYSLTKVDKMIDSHIDFEDFLDLSKDQRGTLLKKYR